MRGLRSETGSLAAFLAIIVSQYPAGARPGETIRTFKQRSKSILRLREITNRDATRFYKFSLLMTRDKLQQAPGFSATLTVTVKEGRIMAESMAFKLGSKPFAGQNLIVEYGLKFANLSLERQINDAKRANEQSLFLTAITSVLMTGEAQQMKFPDCGGSVVLRRGEQGQLLVSVVGKTKEK